MSLFRLKSRLRNGEKIRSMSRLMGRWREEFALASALIKARGDADMTQEQVAAAMGTTRAVVARVESGKTMPSTRTLERFAKATRTKLRIRFEPVRKAAR